MFKNFLTLRTLRRSLVELSRSQVVHMDNVTAQLEKTRNTILMLEDKNVLMAQVDFYESLQRRSAALRSEIDALKSVKLELITEKDDEQ